VVKMSRNKTAYILKEMRRGKHKIKELKNIQE
jgi:hypothetical protein